MAPPVDRMYGEGEMSRDRVTGIVVALMVVLLGGVVDASPRRMADLNDTLLQTVRDHRKALEASLPRREEDVRVASASLDRCSTLYARGAITRDELARAARDLTDARSQLEA